MALTPQEYEEKLGYYRNVLQQERTPEMVFAYAMLLYRSSKDVVTAAQFRWKEPKKREAMELFAEVMERLRDDDAPQRVTLYHKACYRFTRCVIELYRDDGPLKEELDILFPSASVSVSLEKKQLFYRACKAIEAVRCRMALPRRVSSIASLPTADTLAQEPQYVYYTLGQVLDIAGQYRLCQEPHQAYASAKRYYSYACQLDAAQYAQGKRPFLHAFMALLTLCVRLGHLEEAKGWQERYGAILPLPAGFQLLHTIRQAIRSDDYGKARSLLQPYLFQAQWYPGLSKQRAQGLAVIVDIALKRKHPSTAGKTAWQRKQLYRVLHHVEGC